MVEILKPPSWDSRKSPPKVREPAVILNRDGIEAPPFEKLLIPRVRVSDGLGTTESSMRKFPTKLQLPGVNESKVLSTLERTTVPGPVQPTRVAAIVLAPIVWLPALVVMFTSAPRLSRVSWSPVLDLIKVLATLLLNKIPPAVAPGPSISTVAPAPAFENAATLPASGRLELQSAGVNHEPLDAPTQL